MAANKTILSQAEKDAIELKKDKFIESIQAQDEGTDQLSLGKVFEWIQLQIEEQGFEKKKDM